METYKEDETNLHEEELEATGGIEMQEVDVPMLIEMYGEKRLTNLLKEYMQLLQEELLKGKTNIGSISQIQGQTIGLDFRTTQLNSMKKMGGEENKRGKKPRKQKIQEGALLPYLGKVLLLLKMYFLTHAKV